jgi:phosphoribosylglycinamide formyltransferase-1
VTSIGLPIFDPDAPIKVAVFISGTGRTLQNLITCSQTSHKDIFEVCAVASTRLDSPAHEFVFHSTDVPYFIPNPTKNLSEILFSFAEREEARLICLAGFLKLLTIPTEWKNRVINIHPSLLPDFCGKGMYGDRVHKAVIAAKAPKSGCTVHYCDNEYDHGPIILQKELDVDPSWDHNQLASSVFELEKLAFPEAIQQIVRK